jgi:hypothetical protein
MYIELSAGGVVEVVMGQSIVGCIPFVVKTEPRHHFKEYFANPLFKSKKKHVFE